MFGRMSQKDLGEKRDSINPREVLSPSTKTQSMNVSKTNSGEKQVEIPKKGSAGKRILKGVGIFFLFLLILVIAAVLVLQTPPGKEFVRAKAESFLASKLKSKVQIGKLDYSLPTWIELKEVYIEDETGKSLLKGSSLYVSLNMIRLISGDVLIKKVELKNIDINLNRLGTNKDFNFQFIADAFTSKDTTEKTTDKKKSGISLDRLILSDVHVLFNDERGGMYCNGNIGTFNLQVKEFNLDSLDFSVKNIAIENSVIEVISRKANIIDSMVTAVDSAKKAKPSAEFRMLLNNLSINKLAVTYTKPEEQTRYHNDIDTLTLTKAGFSISEKTVSLENLLLASSSIELGMFTPPALKTSKVTDSLITDSASSWDVSVNNILLRKNNFRFDNNYYQPIATSFDKNHLDIKDISLAAGDIHYNANEIKGIIRSGSTILTDELTLQQLEGNIVYNDSGAVIKDLRLKTEGSLITMNGMFRYGMNDSSKKFNARTMMLAAVNNSVISYAELQYLVPSLKKEPPVNLRPDATISIHGTVTGTIRIMQINDLKVSTSDSRFNLQTGGTLYNLDNPKAIKYAMGIKVLDVSKNIMPFKLKAQLAKNKVQLPERIRLNGDVAGSMNDFKGNVNLISSYGTANINGTAGNFSKPKLLLYDLVVTAKNFQTGKWISKDSLLGPLSGVVKVKGQGTEIKNVTANAIVDIQTFILKGIDYNNIDLNAGITKGKYVVNGSIDDELVNTVMDLKGDIVGQYPTAIGTISLNELNLYQMKMVADPLNIRSDIVLNVEDVTPESLNMETVMKGTKIITDKETIYVDSMFVKGKRANDTTDILVKSPFLSLNLKGRYDYKNLATAFQQFIADKTGTENKNPSKVISQQADIVLQINRSDLLKKIVPGLDFDDPIRMTGVFNSERRDTILRLNSTIPSLTYSTTSAENLVLDIHGGDTALRMVATADVIGLKENSIFTPELNIGFAKSKADVFLRTFDEAKKEFYSIRANALLSEHEKTISLQNDLILNYAKWNIEPSNAIHIYKNGYVADNFTISQAGQKLSVNSPGKSATSPLNITVRDFDLKTVFSFFSKDSSLQGNMNSDLTIQQPIQSSPAFSGTVAIQSLAYKKVAIGDLNLKASSSPSGVMSLDGTVKGTNGVTLTGTVNTANNQLNLITKIAKLDMTVLEAFSNGQLERSAGAVEGDIAITGTTKAPVWNGELRFPNAIIVPTISNSPLAINNQKIVLAYPTITFNKFTIKDSVFNSLVIDGSARHTTGADFDLNLNINTKNFVAMNSVPNKKKLISGKVVVDLDAHIGRSVLSPDINGNIILENESDLHFAMMQKDYREELKKVVRFIDRDTVEDFSKLFYDPALNDTGAVVFKGLKYNLNLEVKEKAAVTVLIDPSTGDELKISGSAQLNAGVDESGKLGITGVYNLKDGQYTLVYSVLKRKFNLVDGSTITFAGDPLQAEANVIAHYEVEASPRDLLGNEISENSASLGGAFNSKIPFIVILKIKGPIMKPIISFDIKPKENTSGVNSNLIDAIDNKLAQFRTDESAMNKQVFALLILRRFIGERSNDFFAGVGNTANSAVKQSVSQFLSDAVEQIAADLIKGVDISLDVNNYEEEGNKQNDRTDVSLGLSKRLLNDRLTVMVGKSFTVDGDDPVAKTQTNNNLQFLPDLTTNYKLTKDGRYNVKAYRKNQYEAIVDGYFIETGLVLSLSMNYTRINELFKKRIPID